MSSQPEVWLRGPLHGIPGLLQPVAHTLLQAREEVNRLLQDFPEMLLWQRPVALASPGFHLQHLTGVIDRLFTYAKGKQLDEKQLAALAAEGTPGDDNSLTHLVEAFNRQVDVALVQLQNTREADLTQTRAVGRVKLPSTIIGLYVHAAEHTMRHLGQLLVTVKVLQAGCV